MIESNENKVNNLINEGKTEVDNFENVLRPKSFEKYIGQSSIKKNLKVAIKSARLRDDYLDHILLHGPPGLGKTTLASLIASEAGVSFRVTSGPALEKQGDVASIISNFQAGDVWFIDEIHRLKPAVEEVLYSAMEDYKIDIVIGNGPSARTMTLNLPKFTLIGATTKVSMISSPMRDRFGSVFKMRFYDNNELAKIILQSAQVLKCEIDASAALELAKCSRKTPRIANRLLKRLRDFSVVDKTNPINLSYTQDILKVLGLDALGLDERDREILKIIYSNYQGGPVGLNTLATALAEDSDTLENVYEPYLIRMGLLERTARGRLLTRKAYDHLGIKL